MDGLNYYSYTELKQEAMNNPTAENLNLLGEWFEMYGSAYWNGECFSLEDGKCLYRICEYNEKYDIYEIVGYEIK